MENGENTVSRFEKEQLEICAIFCNDGSRGNDEKL